MTTTIVPAHGPSYSRMQDIRDQAARGVKFGDPFRNNGGSFRGEGYANVHPAMIHSGRMGPDSRNMLRESERIRYVITSYATPIGWLAWDNGTEGWAWVVPSERYSVTTSRHQSQAHWIMMASGFPFAER